MSLNWWKNGVLAFGMVSLLALAGCPKPEYALSVLITGQGSVTLNPPGGTYDAGKVVALTPAPAAGWHFDHWEGALSGSAIPGQVTMDAAKTVTAVFAVDQFALNVLVTGQGSVALDPAGGTYAGGTVVALTPAPAAGWHFDHWEGALSGSANPGQVTMDAAKTVTAVFAVDQYALNVLVTGQGSVALDPSGGTYDAGTVVALTPAPAAGWHFDHWEGALSGNANPGQVTMDAAKTVTAVFAVDQYALNVVVTGQGSVALNPPGGTYDAGMVVTLMATPAVGWHFDHWEGALSGGATGVQITMDAAKEVTAVFEREQYTLDVSAEGGGSVTLDPPGGAYPSGTVVTLTPNPNAGNRFEIWGGELAGTRQPATITMDANKYVQAFFMAETFTSFSPYSLCAVGSTLYFLGTGAYSGQELWKTDGAFAGTTLVKDIAPGHDNAGILFLTNLEETLYFFAVAGGRYGLWTSDGTEAGTVEVTGLDGSSPAMPPLRIGENLYFSASGTENGELWVTDGTAEGTGIVKSFGPASGMQYTNPNNLTNVDGVLYFNNSPQNELFTLWKSDGTEEGTVAVYSSRWLSEIAGLNGQALFYAGSETNDGALLTTDGTPQGTQDLYHFDFGPGDLEVSGGLLFFGAQLNWFNTQVWASNGAAVYKVDGFSYRPWDLTDVDGTLFYMALYDVESQPHCGLFATTGTGGTLVREINPHLFYGYGSEMEDVDGTLFFTAENSYGGVGLWKSDGTTPGTVLVSDITPVPVGIIPYELTAVDDTLFFSAADETYGHQLWKSDGTPAGTLPISCPVP